MHGRGRRCQMLAVFAIEYTLFRINSIFFLVLLLFLDTLIHNAAYVLQDCLFKYLTDPLIVLFHL